VLAVRGRNSSGGSLFFELVIPGRITISPVEGSVGSPRTKNPLNGNYSRIPYSKGSLPRKHNFLKLKHGNIIKMKNKPYPALLRPSNLSNEIKKRVPKSRETIPLKLFFEVCENYIPYVLLQMKQLETFLGICKTITVDKLSLLRVQSLSLCKYLLLKKTFLRRNNILRNKTSQTLATFR
jgi:hypothetical protein